MSGVPQTTTSVRTYFSGHSHLGVKPGIASGNLNREESSDRLESKILQNKLGNPTSFPSEGTANSPYNLHILDGGSAWFAFDLTYSTQVAPPIVDAIFQNTAARVRPRAVLFDPRITVPRAPWLSQNRRVGASGNSSRAIQIPRISAHNSYSMIFSLAVASHSGRWEVAANLRPW